MSKLTPELQNELCTQIAKGINKTDACAAVGIHRKTLNTWLKKGAAKEAERYTDFYQAYHQAYQTAIQSSYQRLVQQVLDGDMQVRTELDADGNVIKIVKTETRSWRGAAWLLEKLFPQLFGEAAENSSAPAKKPEPKPDYAALVALVEQFERRNET